MRLISAFVKPSMRVPVAALKLSLAPTLISVPAVLFCSVVLAVPEWMLPPGKFMLSAVMVTGAFAEPSNMKLLAMTSPKLSANWPPVPVMEIAPPAEPTLPLPR